MCNDMDSTGAQVRFYASSKDKEVRSTNVYTKWLHIFSKQLIHKSEISKMTHTCNVYMRFAEYKVNREMMRVLKLVRH